MKVVDGVRYYYVQAAWRCVPKVKEKKTFGVYGKKANKTKKKKPG